MATVTTLTAEKIIEMIEDLKAGGGFGGGVLDGITGDLGNLAEELAANQALLDELNNVTLPALQVDLANNDILLNDLNDVILPGLQTDLANNESALNTLNTVTLPGLQADLAANTSALNTLNAVTLPALQTDLNANESAINNLNTVTLPALQADLNAASAEVDGLSSKFPIGETDIQDSAITTPKMTANSINGDRITTNTLNAEKIVAGSVTTDRMTANTIHGDRMTINTINAEKIVAGSVTTDRMTANAINGDRITTNTLNAGKIVAGSIATDRMTANTIHGDRMTINTINAEKIVAGSISTDRMTANTINGDRIIINTLNADKITSNTLKAAIVNAGAINGITITGSTVQTALSGNRVVVNSDGFGGVVRFYMGADFDANSYGYINPSQEGGGTSARGLLQMVPARSGGVNVGGENASIVLKSPSNNGAVRSGVEVRSGSIGLTALGSGLSLYSTTNVSVNGAATSTLDVNMDASFSGRITATNYIKANTDSVNVTALNNNSTKNVNFAIPFPSHVPVPTVVASATNITGATTLKVAVSGVTRSGFTINVTRSSGSLGDVDVSWIAAAT